MAERHWREFRPTMVWKFEAEERPMEALFEAPETTKTKMENRRTEFSRQG